MIFRRRIIFWRWIIFRRRIIFRRWNIFIIIFRYFHVRAACPDLCGLLAIPPEYPPHGGNEDDNDNDDDDDEAHDDKEDENKVYDDGQPPAERIATRLNGVNMLHDSDKDDDDEDG